MELEPKERRSQWINEIGTGEEWTKMKRSKNYCIVKEGEMFVKRNTHYRLVRLPPLLDPSTELLLGLVSASKLSFRFSARARDKQLPH